MNKKVLLYNIIIAVIVSLVTQFLPIIIRDHLYRALAAVGFGVVIGILIPLSHLLIKPKTLLAWCLLNTIVVCFSISLINIRIILQKEGLISMLDSYLLVSIFTIIATLIYYRIYKIGNQKLNIKQNELKS